MGQRKPNVLSLLATESEHATEKDKEFEVSLVSTY